MSFASLFTLTILFLIFQLSIQFHSNHIYRLSRSTQARPSLSKKGDIDADEMEGYGPIGSLLRQGPVPFVIRLVNPSTYDAAVNKYMVGAKCNKLEAMVCLSWFLPKLLT